ncbi:MAG: nicotinamide-nucleotide amidase [Gammaproteobacteria bacterium]|jgi:nicotinamide-nucleotide amidase|nr:nicotinamide-nucleotide amidase [Gammaproteobacteria bacterium]MDH3985329.1 nicotinamide-nucleotide amidase [Gammaproteobacteria bacterium]
MDKLTELSQQLAKLLLQQQKRLAVAESCTGGWLAKTVTDLAGSSQWFERGFVTYSNAAKQEMLGVRPKTLLRDGAVSEAVVQEMALGALLHSQADISVAISGIAGPDGAVPGKPVGTVCFSWALKDHSHHQHTKHFEGDREAVRLQSVVCALEGLLDVLGKA